MSNRHQGPYQFQFFFFRKTFKHFFFIEKHNTNLADFTSQHWISKIILNEEKNMDFEITTLSTTNFFLTMRMLSYILEHLSNILFYYLHKKKNIKKFRPVGRPHGVPFCLESFNQWENCIYIYNYIHYFRINLFYIRYYILIIVSFIVELFHFIELQIRKQRAMEFLAFKFMNNIIDYYYLFVCLFFRFLHRNIVGWYYCDEWHIFMYFVSCSIL